jgi:hypothetical protein
MSPSSSSSLGRILSRLTRERDEKRKAAERMSEERNRLNQQIATLNAELMELDEEIDQLETQQLRQLSSQSVVKQEPGTAGGGGSASSSPLRSQPPLTTNLDEILTELTQEGAPNDAMNEDQEILTDPLTWTQAEKENTDTIERPSSSSGRAPIRPLDVRPVERKPPAKLKKDTTTGPMDEYLRTNNNSNNENSNNDWAQEEEQGNSALATGSASAASARRVTLGSASSPYFQSSSATTNARNCPYSTHDITQTLRQSFQLQSFRENQLEIIQTTLSGKDCFVLMKTGGGKSLVRRS